MQFDFQEHYSYGYQGRVQYIFLGKNPDRCSQKGSHFNCVLEKSPPSSFMDGLVQTFSDANIMNVPLTNNCGQGCFDEVRRWLISQNILIMIVTGTAMSLQVSEKYLYFMLILVYFASDFQHNSNIVYVRPDKQNYLWTFCLILELYIGTLVLCTVPN